MYRLLLLNVLPLIISALEDGMREKDLQSKAEPEATAGRADRDLPMIVGLSQSSDCMLMRALSALWEYHRGTYHYNRYVVVRCKRYIVSRR